MLKYIATAVLTLLLLPISGWSAVIYVDASGGDDATGDGSSGNPYQTFDKGYTMASAGDTLDLTGTFDWSVQTTNIASPTGYTLAKNLTIRGQGIDNTYIQAQASKGTSIDRMVFYINNVDIIMEDLTIRYGYLTSAGGGYGAGISVMGASGSLNISSSKIFENVYSGGSFGLGTAGGIGIQSSGGILVMDDCIVDSNERLNYQYYGAAGIACGQGGNITITNSLISNNTTNVTSPAAGSAYASPAGGLCMYRFSDLVLTNTTFYNNTTNGAGGAMNLYYSYDFVLTNNTIVDNSVTGGNTGGGIAHAALAAGHELVLKNNLIANNSPEDLTTYEGTTARITDNGYNIIESATTSNTGSGTYSWDASTITGAQANLFGTGVAATPALDDNSTNNSTQTIALSLGSVAIDAGDDATHSDANVQTTVAIPSTDQRGISRSGTVDIGAYEYQPTVFDPHGGYAIDFDGTDDHIIVANDASLNPSNITVEAWFFPEDIAGQTTPPILRKGDASSGYTLEFDHTSNELSFFVYVNGVGFQASPTYTVSSLDTWYHVAGTYDGSDVSLYINGELVGSTAAAGTILHSSNDLYIGSEPTFGGRFFEGKIDEVRIWSDIRTQDEIQANMHKELSGSEGNLEAYFPMHDGSGTSLSDNSSNGNTGTLTDGPTWKTSGAHAGPGSGLDFDGSDDYVSVPDDDALDLTNTFTIEGWINPDALSNYGRMVSKNNAFGLGFNTTLIRFTTYNVQDYDLTYSLPTGTWSHIAIVMDASNDVTFYVDGNDVGTISGTNPATVTTHPLLIGSSTYSAIEDFDGKIDEVRIWGDERTEAEIRANMYRTLDGDEDDLIAYYRFDQQADALHTTLFDQTSNGHDGTLTNMDASTDWVSVSPFNTWIGSDDSDWGNSNNWSLGTKPTSEHVGVYSWVGSNDPSSSNISGSDFYLDDGVTLSHSGNLTLSGDFYNAGTFSTSGNVTFSGSATQTIRGTGTTTFGTMIINNSNGVTMEQDVTASSGLTLTDGIVDLNGQTLTLGNSASVSGTPAASNHVNATNGNLIKGYSGTGSFTFPVGDGTVYTPIALNFTSGSFASASATVNLTASKHPNNGSSTDYLERYWTVSSSGISGFNCAVTATYDDGDIQGTEADMVGGKWDGANWTDLGGVTSGSNQVTGTVSSFSDFTAGEPGAFPVEWLHFSAQPLASSVQLDWATAAEINSDYFAIERSADQTAWEELGQVTAVGNSQEIETYEYQDEQPLQGRSWYRLRQVDLDGAYQYSSTVQVHFSGFGVSVYPNPTQDELNIQASVAQEISAQLSDLQGRILLSQSLKNGKQTLSIANLPTGLYQLTLENEQGWQQTFRIVKE